jgi:chromate transporter
VSDSLVGLFRRFLRFGWLAWGGPAAQIGMLREELVDREKWMDSASFNRTLAVYQALPGPEATELCVHFGYLRRGRLGGLVAGLGFLLPGLVMMLALSWVYASVADPAWLALLVGFAPAVAALVVRATARLGEHALHSAPLLLVGVGSLLATSQGVPFYVVLPLAGLLHVASRTWPRAAIAALSALAVASLLWPAPPAIGPGTVVEAATLEGMAASGLKAGLLTFGGAYTVIPFLQQDATWVTPQQFVDGIALGGVIPAPLVIFSAFLGFLGGSWLGALVMTVAIFLPAFSFTLLGFPLFERLVNAPRIHAFLDGVTAGVIGLIAFTAMGLFVPLLAIAWQSALFVAAIAALFAFRQRWTVPAVVLSSGVIGALLA